MEKSIDTLSGYGSTFQTKTISCLMTDRSFLNQIYDVLSTKFYDSEAKKWIVEKVIEYYDEYDKTATPDYLKSELKDVENDTLKVSIVEETRKVWNHKDDDDLDYVKDEFLEFAKNQKIKLALLDSVDLLKENNFGKIRTMMNNALDSGISRDVGHVYKEEVDSRMKESSRDGIPTGWEVVNDVLDGGLAPGELGVVVAPSGVGKSWCLSHLGLSAMKEGYNVSHYTLELDENQTGLRYDSILSGYPPNEVREHKDEVKEAIENISGDLSIKYYPTKSASPQTLHAHFDKQQVIRGRPDIILVDYADLLSSNGSGDHGDNTYLQMGDIYNQLRKLAGELQVPVWTVSQAKRDSIGKEIIKADDIAESFKKMHVSDFIMSLSRKKSDKLSKTGRFFVMKNRIGSDGHVFPALINLGKGIIQMYDPDSQKGLEIQDKMKKSEGKAEKELLRKKKANFDRKKKNGSSNGEASSDDMIEELLNDKKEETTGITV